MFPGFQTFLNYFRNTTEDWYEFLLGRPSLLLGRQGRKVWRMFRQLPAAPAATIYGGMLWVIPLAMASPYTSLYMVKMGLSETEVGVYQSLAQIIGPVALFAGGYLS